MTTSMHESAAAFDQFDRQNTVLLTTFKRDGTPVGTPVNIAVDGDHAYVRTWNTAGKLKRMRNNAHVEIAPSTLGGTPTGPAISARARILDGADSALAARLIASKHPFLHGFLVPLFHRMRGYTTMQIELTAEAGTRV